jgi:competence protein ComGC
LIVTPVGAAMRALGRDAVSKVLDGSIRSYRVDIEKTANVRDYYRQIWNSAMNDERKMRFEKAATQGDRRLLVEYMQFLFHNKKYWLAPIMVVLFLIGLLVMLGGSAAGAFIYTLF